VTEAELRAEVTRVLRKNLRSGRSELLDADYCYIAPALDRYPFQWFWDTFFHVFILLRLGENELAERNLRSLFTMQQESGFVGHMVFWKQALPKRRTDIMQSRPTWRTLRPHMSALIQPCFAATALLRLYEASGDLVLDGEMYAHVRRYHEWLARERDFDGDGLLTLISPFESGMDWKPSFDPVLGRAQRTTPRRFLTSTLFWQGVHVDLVNFVLRYDLERIKRRERWLVKDAGFNAIYAFDLEAMAKLASLAGDDPSPFVEHRRRVVESIVALMYDEELCAFCDLREPGSEKIPVITPTIFFPLIAPEVDDGIAARMLERHFDDADGFATPFPLPSVERRDPAFFAGETPFIWRGPTWAFNNWFVYQVLKRRGFDERAERLKSSLAHAVEIGGMREYYDPNTGEGYGAVDFTWSGLLLDMS
jgi:glycogen debranching enzyme